MNNEQEIIEEVCQSYGILIEKAFIKAITHFYDLHKNELLTIRLATKASLINDYIYQFIQEELEGTGPFEFINKSKGRFIGYDSKILIRIKKLSKAKTPTVNKTHAANQFNTQVDMDLLEDAKTSNVYLGYVLNNKSGNIDEVAFAYPNTEGVIAWTINIEEQAVQKALDLDIVPFPKDPDSPKPSHFKPKKSKRKTVRK